MQQPARHHECSKYLDCLIQSLSYRFRTVQLIQYLHFVSKLFLIFRAEGRIQPENQHINYYLKLSSKQKQKRVEEGKFTSSVSQSEASLW